MKKLLIFLMLAIPVMVILIVKLTATVVVGDMFISVENISLNKDSIIARVGEIVDMECYIYPDYATNKEVMWSSNNEAAATVDINGRVTFLDIGSGYITATTKDGNKRCNCPFYVWDTEVHKIELVAPSKYVHVNGDLQLTATVLPNEATNKGVLFTSDNEKIATVDTNGLVHGVGEGYVTITAETEDGGFTDFVNLLVINPVTALRVDANEIITAQKSEQIAYIIEPKNATNKNVVFELDDETVATINHLGVITFLKPGEVNVTLTTEDGEFEQTIKYIYTGGYAYDLILDNHSINMNVDSAPIYINYSLVPQNLYNLQAEFGSDDENIAYVDKSGYLHAVKGGNTVIRISVQKSENEKIEKQIYVNVISPATDLEVENGITALNSYQINVKSLPEGSTNTAYFYHINGSADATVSASGLITFNSNSPCTVSVTIYANEDYSSVKKQIEVVYTAGKASQFSLLNKTLNLNYGEVSNLNYKILPADAFGVKINSEIIESTTLAKNGIVAEILEDGRIRAVSGGKAKIKVWCELYNGEISEQICEINVVREAESVEINLELDFYQNRYITSENSVDFAGKVLPEDATNTNIVWQVSDKNIAFIHNGRLMFNQEGFVTLTATVDEVSSSVEVYYVGMNPVYAEVNAIFNGETVPVPTNIKVGESFKIQISKIVPNYTTMPAISLQITNPKTVHSLGKVLKAENGEVTGLAGGSANLVVYVSNSVRLTFTINVEQKPQSVSVLQADTQTTSPSVNLISEVLPYDATNKNVKYLINEADVATVDGSVLTFLKNGIAHITAVCEADESVVCYFYIEKIEKNMVHISIDQTNVSVVKGDVLTFDVLGMFSLAIKDSKPAVENETVAQIEDERYLRTISAGKVVVALSIDGNEYNFEIVVNQLVEEIELTTQMDEFNGEYVVARDVVDLTFNTYPTYAHNKELNITITQSVSAEGKADKIASINNGRLTFIKAGRVTLQVVSADGNCTSILNIRHTGGAALDAQLNVGNRIVLNVNDVVTIGVLKWLPFDVVDSRILFKDVVNTSGKNIIELNNSTKTIKALDSGECKLVVQLSSGIIKEVEIVCINKVADIQLEEEVLTSSNSYTINAFVLPANATNKTLEYVLNDTDLATISYNVLHFIKAGTVSVLVRSTDGSNIEKTIKVTSTMGCLSKLVLSDTSQQINKGEVLRLFVDTYPTDATNNKVEFKIISQTAYNGKDQVISLTSDGQITALCRGQAIVRAFALDFYNQEIYVDCTIIVNTPLNSVDVVFKNKLDNYQNLSTFITSKSEIEFSQTFMPEDAKIENYFYDISATNIAKVEGNKIMFLQKGRVSITFRCADYLNVEQSKTYNFYYVGDEIIEATLNHENIVNNVIRLEAGQSISFSLTSVLPSDATNLTFSIADMVENRNDPNKQVASFDNGVLSALNGGTASFSLYVSGLKLESLTLIVTRQTTDIVIDGETEVYISEPHYTINAHVLETDSSQKALGYKTNSQIAMVDTEGVVTFVEQGECEITVYVVENPAVFKIVKIEYTKELQKIVFNQSRESIDVGGYVDLSVSAQPTNYGHFDYEMTVDNNNLAQLVKRDDGYRLIGLASGTVVVTARVIGKDVSATKTITIYDKISEITLELDYSDDLSGHGGYRVFGNKFVAADKSIINTYTMNVSLIPQDSSKDLLEWSSNNESVATVDQFGVVTFLGTGRVTITVKQKVAYEGVNVAFDSYEFIVVDGVNVYSYEQFAVAHPYLTQANKDKKENYSALVLHNNITLDASVKTVVFGYNVYGNGKMLDHSKINSNWEHFVINKNGVVLDNVVLHATSFTSAVELKGTGSTLMINNCSNVLVYNTYVENAETAIRVQSSQVVLEGCLFRSTLLADIKIARSENAVSNVKVKDCIFTSSFCGVMFIPDFLNTNELSTLTLEGEVRFYNWSSIDQIEQGLDLQSMMDKVGLSFASGEVFKQLREIARSKGAQYAFEYNNTTYYNFGVVNLSASIANKSLKGSGKIEMSNLNPNCKYFYASMTGALNFAIVVPVQCSILTVTPSQSFIKPGDSYLDKPAVLASIKKPCRF